MRLPTEVDTAEAVEAALRGDKWCHMGQHYAVRVYTFKFTTGKVSTTEHGCETCWTEKHVGKTFSGTISISDQSRGRVLTMVADGPLKSDGSNVSCTSDSRLDRIQL